MKRQAAWLWIQDFSLTSFDVERSSRNAAVYVAVGEKAVVAPYMFI